MSPQADQNEPPLGIDTVGKILRRSKSDTYGNMQRGRSAVMCPQQLVSAPGSAIGTLAPRYHPAMLDDADIEYDPPDADTVHRNYLVTCPAPRRRAGATGSRGGFDGEVGCDRRTPIGPGAHINAGQFRSQGH